ncbi:MAG: MlaD family protein [Candidatus Aureabacteria bacterium]|nr:MlaD family protein [Candidatus Auribacterota bacterium]
MGLSTEMKVGAVFFVGICLLILFTVVLSDIRLFKKYYTCDVIFDTVGGLQKDDKITMGGMEIGHVSSLILEDKQIRVRLAIRQGSRIPKTASFRVGDVGIMGGKRVDISWGEETNAILVSGAEIRGITSPGLSEAIANLGESGAKIEKILASTQEVADRLARGEGTVGKLLKEDQVYEDVKAVAEEMKDAAPHLNRTLANLEEITQKINQGEGTIGKLISDDEVYESAQETLASVKTASQKLTTLVSRAERVEFYIGAQSAYNIDTRKYLSKVYVQIEPTSSKLYYLGFSRLAGPGTQSETTDDPDNEFDAQIGLRFFSDRLTVRAGLLEGRVGGGLEWRIWDRKLVATVEARDVWTKEKDEGISPFLLRAYVNLDLIWGFYLMAGGDNLLDNPAPIVGGGLRLRDDDIKALFGVASLGQ